MNKRKSNFAFFALPLIALALAVGCSKDTTTLFTSNSIDPEDYFPLQTRYTTHFDVREYNGNMQELTFQVGSPVSVAGQPGYQWLVNSSNGGYDTSYFVATESGLYLYGSLSSIPEQILSFPLETGASWNRYESFSSDNAGDETNGGGTTNGGLKDIIDGEQENQGFKDSSDAGIASSYNFPTDGANTLTKESIEEVALKNGTKFSESIKIKNAGSDGYNYYWFAPGIGLVKYIIGTSENNSANGRTVGEISHY